MFGLFCKPIAAAPQATAYDFSFHTIDGATLPLSEFKGRLLLVVNTASKCGFTPQYAGLETLYKTYHGRGLDILGVPSNDFGGQEPGSAPEIKSFCLTNYNISFPLAAKEVVSGNAAHPFYRWAAAQNQGNFLFTKPRWNFHKYLVGTDGTLIGSWSSATKPDDPVLVKAIEAALPLK